MATSEGPWRLKVILILFFFVTMIYGSYGVFGSITTMSDYEYELDYGKDNITGQQIGDYNISQNETYSTDESGDDFIGMLTGFGNFATFENVDNVFARMLLTSATSICFIVIGYLIYTFIRDWIPFTG